jgi:thioredoxin reductase (NADPH)
VSPMFLDKIESLASRNLGLIGLMLLAGITVFLLKKRVKTEKKSREYMDKAVKANLHEPLTLHPEIDQALCAGCGACVRACPEGEIIQLVDHKAVLVSASKCVGHGQCEVVCPFGAISLVFGTKSRGMDIPRISSHYETNVSGLYIAGELGGMGLIRNAVKQGVLAASHALDHLPKTGDKTEVDLLIVGAGPAGLAASLTAASRKAKYVCIEQGSFGGTVYNFPWQKVVMTHPAELPLAGKMKFPSNKVTKEELLAFWNDVRKRFQLHIKEETKFEMMEAQTGGFKVQTSRGPIRAKKVILAMGVRGSPRRLGLANEDLPKVTYNLLDPEQYQGRFVAVVGGGNAGVEAAQYLAKPSLRNKVLLLVRGPGFDRCNEENQNIIFDMEKKGQVVIWYKSSVKEIHEKHLLIDRDGTPKKLQNDYLFVFAGAELPHKFLMGLGIRIEKKFGEKLKSS